MSFLPILAIGGAIILFTGKKRRKRATKNGNRKVLPAVNGRGTIFQGDTEGRPDLIKAKVGERFSVSMSDIAGSSGYSWSLAASPPDNSVTHVKTEYDKSSQPQGQVGGSGGADIYIFEGAKPGTGSLVFHLQAPWLEGKEPPSTIVEILTEIS